MKRIASNRTFIGAGALCLMGIGTAACGTSTTTPSPTPASTPVISQSPLASASAPSSSGTMPSDGQLTAAANAVFPSSTTGYACIAYKSPGVLDTGATAPNFSTCPFSDVLKAKFTAAIQAEQQRASISARSPLCPGSCQDQATGFTHSIVLRPAGVTPTAGNDAVVQVSFSSSGDSAANGSFDLVVSIDANQHPVVDDIIGDLMLGAPCMSYLTGVAQNPC